MNDEAKFLNHGTVRRKHWGCMWRMLLWRWHLLLWVSLLSISLISFLTLYSYFLSNTETLPYRIFFHGWTSSLLDRYLNISVSSTLFSLNNNCCPINSFIFPPVMKYLRYWMSIRHHLDSSRFSYLAFS